MSRPYSGIQNYLPKLFTLLQPLVRRSGFAQREAPVDHGFELAGEDMLHHLMKLALGSHERSQEGKLAREEEADIEGGFRAGSGAAGYDLAARLERLHALLPGSFAHVLKNDVAHGAVGDVLHFFGDFLLV